MASFSLWCFIAALTIDNHADSFSLNRGSHLILPFGNGNKLNSNLYSQRSLVNPLRSMPRSLVGKRHLFDEALLHIDPPPCFANFSCHFGWYTCRIVFCGKRLSQILMFNSTDISNEVLTIVKGINSTASLISRPGFTFGLGCDEWEASSYSGSIEGWNSEPMIRWWERDCWNSLIKSGVILVSTQIFSRRFFEIVWLHYWSLL